MVSTAHDRAPPPGRNCPLHYRYTPSALAREPDLAAETLYVVGGLYGNLPALQALFERAAREPGGAMLVFNGDFNWFNIDPPGFAAINQEIMKYAALRGNVETELAGEDREAGCGCGYPEWVSDAEVERSNDVLSRLRATARLWPELRARLAALPMHLVADVGGLRVAIVHGDTESLAGWKFSQEALTGATDRSEIAAQFDAARARVIASSHTCLPVALDISAAAGQCALVNNGAAGIPNFRDTQYGVITRIGVRPAADALYGARIEGVHVDALPLHYDHARWEREFLANWPPGSPAHTSYYRRIMSGPAYTLAQAARGAVSFKAQP